MAGKNLTTLQKLNNFMLGNSVPDEFVKPQPTFNMQNVGDEVLFSTRDKDEYERRLTQMQQQKLMSWQWVKAGNDSAMDALAGYTAVKLMYRDSDLMDGTPEIGTALDIIGQEACPLNSQNKMLNIYSKSQRVKSVLEDLFVNRLNIYTELPPIARKMAKYGNVFRLLNINAKEGIQGWRDLPVYEIDRIENGFTTGGIAGGATIANTSNLKPDEVCFVWNGHNESQPYRNFQVAHFRLLNDTFFLPYGTSCLHKSRRAWRMWSMMEDAMLIYRLDKSIERRVYKIYVGAIDEQDVQAYVQDVANNFKRTPIIDPQTGQVDLRKNFMDVSTDYFIPVRSENASNPIESLAGATWQNQMEDIEYMQNKIFCGMQVPKAYLNFQDAQGKGENLAIKDIRFARMINRVQQFLLTELNKIAMIHLFLIGMTDDLSNFSLSLNNPTNQIEDIELDMLTKRVGVATQVLADPGIGMPLYSLHKTLRDVMKLSDKEIKDMLQEIRLEKAMAAELEGTANIIKKTGIFDETDRIYGDYEAMNSDASAAQAGAGGEGGDAAAGGGAMPGLDMGGGDMGAEAGVEGDAGMGDAAAADAGTPMEGRHKSNNLLTERKTAKTFIAQYFDMLNESGKLVNGEEVDEAFDFEVKNTTINNKVNEILSKVDDIIGTDDEEENDNDMDTIDLLNKED